MVKFFRFRPWLLTLACLLMLASGCAGSRPSWSAAGLWDRITPGKKKDARPEMSVAAKSLKDPVNVYLKYARLQEEMGDLAKARESYEMVLGENPKSVDAVIGLARLDQLAGRDFEAEQGYLRALQMRPNDPVVLDAAGQFYVAEQRWDEAVEKLNAAMMAAPTEPTYRYHLAVALARAGQIDAAMPHFAKTVGDAEAHYNVGYILYEKGELAAAEQQFLQAVLKKPGLESAQQMLDEVRRTQEDRMMAQRPQPAPSHVQQSSNWQQHAPATAYYGQPSPPAGVVPAATGTRWPDDPAPAHDAGYAWGGQPARTAPAYAAPPAPAQTPAPSYGQVSPAQLEQWRNQMTP